MISQDHWERYIPELNIHLTSVDEREGIRDRLEMAKVELVRRVLGNQAELYKDPNGKPLPVDHWHLSLSHSGSWLVLSKGSCNHGIDIQRKSAKIDRVAGKFMHPDEWSFAETQPLFASDYRWLLWCTKEALFKIYGTQVTFKEIYCLVDQILPKGSFICTFKNVTYRAVYEYFDDYCLVAVVEAQPYLQP
jgi:phosphopantetheinyl transferase